MPLCRSIPLHPPSLGLTAGRPPPQRPRRDEKVRESPSGPGSGIPTSTEETRRFRGTAPPSLGARNAEQISKESLSGLANGIPTPKGGSAVPASTLHAPPVALAPRPVTQDFPRIILRPLAKAV